MQKYDPVSRRIIYLSSPPCTQDPVGPVQAIGHACLPNLGKPYWYNYLKNTNEDLNNHS